MKWALIIAGALIGLIVLVVLIGAMLPRDHVATVTAVISAPPDRVWATLTDVGTYPTWRSDVQRVEVISQPPAPLTWTEHSTQGAITLAVETFEPPRRMVGRIADKDLPFGGAWEYVLSPDSADANKTRITITERGYVTNPIFRFVSRFVLGHYATLETYLKALGRRFGDDVTPVRA
jgi:uncharacterized protein YndB with AHSA1/START domain